MQLLSKKLSRAFSLTQDLVNHLEEHQLQLTMPNLPSNSIGEQLYCIIGTRESYFKAIIEKKWMGWACSLENATSKTAILKALDLSGQPVINLISNTELDETQIDFVFSILEHEIQHHGQLIRYIYGNKLTFPKSWNKRYTV